MAKKSNEIRHTDGRKNNKRLPAKVQLDQSPTSKPARMNEAKKKQIPKYAEKVAISVFGSVEGALQHLAEAGKDGDFNSMKQFLLYLLGKPESYHEDTGPTKKAAPVINFINYQEQPKIEEDIIDIESEDVTDGDDTEEYGD